MNLKGRNTVGHALILVLLDVNMIRIGVCRERGFRAFCEDLLHGTEGWMRAWDA